MKNKRKIFILSALGFLNSFPIAYGGEAVVHPSSKNVNVAKVNEKTDKLSVSLNNSSQETQSTSSESMVDEKTDKLSVSLNNSSQKTQSISSESIKCNQNDATKLTKTGLTFLAVVGLFASPRIIAHEALFQGNSILGYSRVPKIYYKDFNLYRAKGKIQIKYVLSKKLKLTLCGYELNRCDGPPKNICILFHGNGDDSRFDINSVCDNYSAKNTIFVSFEYPTRRYFKVHQTLWWMDEDDIKSYADDIYDFVQQTYIDGKNDNEKPRIIVRGWSLGGYPASYLAGKDDVSCVILDSPVSLTSMFRLMTRPLFGFHLNSIKNILNVTRTKPLDLVMRSGGDDDFLSLDKTISYELGKKFTTPEELKNELNQRLKGRNINLKEFTIGYGGHDCYGSSDHAGYYIGEHYK